MQRTKLGAVVCLLGGVAACSAKGTASELGIERAPRTVTVQNDNWLDVVVYVVRNNTRQRLGSVPGLRTETLPLPRTMVADGTVRFLLDPIGSAASYTMHPVYAAPGQRIELTVRHRLNLSTLAVWNQ